MSDAILLQGLGSNIRKTAAAAIAAGEVHQLADGRAGVKTGLNAAALGDPSNFSTEGQYTMTKTSGVVLLDGGRAYWDHSANAVTFEKVSDRDFYLGRVVGDCASTDTTCVVNLNVDPRYDIDLAIDPFTTAIVLTAGTPALNPRGGGNELTFSATAEAQKVDMLSVDSWALGANAIVEGAFRVLNKGDASALDFNVGIANATHASDADSITESCFIHMDGSSLNINAESDDGTTEVAATDTTVDATEGAAVTDRVEFWMDTRNPADIQIYVNGALVLGSTVFKLDAATGPLKLLAHLEKSSDDTPGSIAIDWLRARFAEQ